MRETLPTPGRLNVEAFKPRCFPGQSGSYGNMLLSGGLIVWLVIARVLHLDRFSEGSSCKVRWVAIHRAVSKRRCTGWYGRPGVLTHFFLHGEGGGTKGRQVLGPSVNLHANLAPCHVHAEMRCSCPDRPPP